MSITVGTLIVDLQANTASFVQGLDKAGQISLISMKNIERAMSAMASAATAAFFAVEGALLVMMQQAISNAARLYDMAQATGVSVAALSGLEYIAKQSGISVESMDKALEKMAKSMDKAASSTFTSTNAYKTLKVAVTDVNNRLRPTQDVLADLADKFSKTKDGPEKTALAIQIFGKAGAELVPLLNRGKEGITELIDEARRLGLVLDDDTARMAKKFEESMNRVKASATGVALSIAKDSLPYLNYLFDSLAAGSTDSQSRFKDLIEASGFMAQAFVINFSKLQALFDVLGVTIKHWGAGILISFDSMKNALAAIAKGDFGALVGIAKESNAAILANDKLAAAEKLNIWKENTDGIIAYLNAAEAKKPAAKKRTGEAPEPPSKEQMDFTAAVEKQIVVLQAAADKMAILAIGQRGSTAATIAATAAAEANALIERLNAEAIEKHVKVLTDKQKARILDAETEKAYATVANELIKNLDDSTTKTKEQTQGVVAMTAAWRLGGEAISKAQEDAKLEPFRKKVEELQIAFEKLTPAEKAAFNGAAAKELNVAKAALAAATIAVHEYTAAEQAQHVVENTLNTETTVANIRARTKATQEGIDALRQEAVQEQINAVIADRTGKLDAAGKAAAIANIREIAAVNLELSNQQKLAAIDKVAQTQQEINDLIRLGSQVKMNAEQQMAFDARIHDLELQKQKDMDDLLLKTNSVRNGFKAYFDQYIHDGTTAAQKVADAMKFTIDGFTNALADGLAKGKVDFNSFIESVYAMLLKLAMNQIFKMLFGGLMNILGGLGGGAGAAVSAGGGGLGGWMGMAEGGAVNAGQLYQVGEKGREWFIPSMPGTIVPSASTKTAMGAESKTPLVIQQTFNIQTPSPDAFRASQDQIAAKGYAAAARAAQRNG